MHLRTVSQAPRLPPERPRRAPLHPPCCIAESCRGSTRSTCSGSMEKDLRGVPLFERRAVLRATLGANAPANREAKPPRTAVEATRDLASDYAPRTLWRISDSHCDWRRSPSQQEATPRDVPAPWLHGTDRT